MTFADAALRWQRWLLAATLLGSAVLILPAGVVEPFMLPKATIVVALAVALGALVVARALWGRSLHLPSSPVSWAVAAFALALVLTTVTSGERWASVIGFYGRYTGLVPYAAYLLIFLVVLRLGDPPLSRLLARTALVALAATVAYGLLQAVGVEPFGFTDNGLGTTFSFFGNVNFSAAWAGAVVGLALMTALDASEHRAWRVAGAALVPLTLLYVVATGTSQGLVVAAASLGWAGLLIATQPGSRVRETAAQRRGLVLGLGAGALLLLAVAIGAAFPFLRRQLDQSLVERPEFWAAGLDIFAANPVLGTGLDTYAHHFLAFRPASHALANGTATTDAPHSVLLGMFSNGGLVLGLTYVAVIVTVAVVLVRGSLRAQGPTRLALAGWGGVWLGYQLQALISFDVPPLAVLHWMSAGLVVALAAPPRWRQVSLPGPTPSRNVTRSGTEYGDYAVPTSTHVLQGAVAVLALVALWFTAYPLRADVVAADAAPLTATGRLDEALAKFDRADSLNPAEARYTFLSARVHEVAGRPEQALAEAAEAARRDPGTVQYPLFAARRAQELGDQEQARRWLEEAVDRDPRDPPVLNEAAAYLASVGDDEAARQLFERSLELDPANAVARDGLAGLQGTS